DGRKVSISIETRFANRGRPQSRAQWPVRNHLGKQKLPVHEPHLEAFLFSGLEHSALGVREHRADSLCFVATPHVLGSRGLEENQTGHTGRGEGGGAREPP